MTPYYAASEPDRPSRLNAFVIGGLIACVFGLAISQAQTYRDMRRLDDNTFHEAIKVDRIKARADVIKEDLDRLTMLKMDQLIGEAERRVGPAPSPDATTVRWQTFDRRPSQGGTR